jgi:transposase
VVYYGEKNAQILSRRCPVTVYVGVDLHSNNNYVGIIDQANTMLFKKKLPNDLGTVLSVLEPFRTEVAGIAVESTFNWYWFVDGLMEHGYTVYLANPAAIQQYEGLKNIDDRRSALWLANLLRLGILPTGYIYPKEERPVRDLLRKRSHLVRHRTSHILSIKNIMSRSLGVRMKSDDVKKLDERQVRKLFPDEHLFLAVNASVTIMRHLTQQIGLIEAAVLAQAKLRGAFSGLRSLPGIGEILALTIMLEAGDMRRFPDVGDYASYCRCVKSSRTSNGKRIGEGNRKNGNKYLSWAYVEAANIAKRYCPIIHRFYQRKMSQTNQAVAIKAISNKLARASYYVVRDQVAYDATRLFGGRAEPVVGLASNQKT